MASISSARSPRTCGPPRRCNPRGGSRRDSSASRLGFQLVEPPPLGSSSRRRPTAVREKFNAARNFMNPSPQRKLGLNSACQKPRLVPGATERTGARRICGGTRKPAFLVVLAQAGTSRWLTWSPSSPSLGGPRVREGDGHGNGGSRNQVRGGGQRTKRWQYRHLVPYAWSFPGQQ
jgi:hypothetical protein